MIIHSPIISGSLEFAEGATFTLPDNGIYSGSFSGSIAVHEVKSHLVPDTNETYDLGSATNRFRDLYLSNNTINFPGGGFGFGDNGFGFNLPSGDPAPIVAAEVKVVDAADGSFAKLSVVGGTLTTTAFDPFGVESAFDMKSQLSGSFTGSFLGEMLATNGVVSGSSQIVIGSVSGFSTFSSSVDGQILIEKGRIDAILASSDADKDSFAEIVTLINSVDTTNDNAFASFYTASNDRFDNIEGFTASIDSTIKTKLDADSVVSGSSQLLSLLPSGVVSSSAQVDADSITNFDSNVKTKLDVDSVVSSSVQVDVLQTTNFNTFSSSIADTFSGLSSNYVDLVGIPSGIISSSEQLAADFLDTLGDNVVSSSAQVDLTQTTNYASGIKLKLDAENVFSSSAQVSIDDTTGFNAFSSSVSDTFDGLSSNYVDLVGIPSGIVSGSSQIDVTATTNYSTVSSHISSTSNPHSVTATQVGLGNVDNTSDANKPVSTATQTALNLKANGSDLTAHEGRTDNPHSVTKAQVGLGNVDNTSDVNKPVSTATQTALNLKADVSSLNVEKGRIDAILTGSSADKDSFAEIVTLINSVDTTNDSAFAGFVTSSNAAQAVQDGRLDALESDSSLSTHEARTDNPHSVTKAQVGLGNVDNTSDANKPVSTATQTALNTKLNINGDNVLSSSAQVLSELFGETLQLGDISGSNLYLTGNAVIAGNLTIGDTANDTISFAADVSSDILPSATNTYDLGSATDKFAEVHATNLYGTTNGVVNATNGIVSGSSQVTLGDVTGFNTFSSSVSDTFDGLSSNYEDLVGIPSGIVSGSSQIDVTATTNYSTISSHISSTSNPHSVTATQVGLGNVTNESKATMFTSPTLTGTTTVGSISFGDATIATASGTLGITATSGISLLTSGGGDGVTIAANGNTTIYGALALQDIASAGTATSALVVGAGNVVSQRALGSNAFTSTAFATDADLTTHVADTNNPHSVTKAQVGLGSVDNTSDANKPISTATQTALDGKQVAGSYVTTTSAQSLSSAANALTLVGNTLTLSRGNSTTDTVDLSAYLDEDSRSISSGTLNSVSGIVTFTRDDASTFTLDLSDLLDDTNLVTSVNGRNGVVVTTLGDYGVTATAAELNKLDGVTATTAELNFVDGVTSNIQTQLNGKQAAGSYITTATTFGGHVSGTYNNIVVNDNSHSHIIGNVLGLQTALNNKYDASNPAGYTTYTSNQATNTTSAVTFASVNGGTITGTSVSVTGDVVAYSSSDNRLKDNVKNIENAIQKVQSLNGVTWDWNDNADELQKSIPNVGVIAQEVEQVLPQLVKDRENGYKGVDYAKLTGLLIEAIKEQQVQIDELKSKLG